ncbi:MAG TPA: EamA family transporter [Nostocaceae cyanobacterium]|nr:EamA family transporter [Nostocaceae cyanobacterium]
MGRFEKRPDNQRAKGDLSRAAENVLWDVVDDLENLQKNILKSLQDDVKRLEAEKTRLVNDIHKLVDEKEQLQQSRQITEQQILIRQLAEVLAKHISSQLQSSLKALAAQAVENEENRDINLDLVKSAQADAASEISKNVGQMLDHLDDTVTIALNSIQQELKNYQGHLSQQLSRMYDQQQQGEVILAEFVNRLRGELEKTKDSSYPRYTNSGTPTVLQVPETYKNGYSEKSTERLIADAVTFIPQNSPSNGTETATLLQPPQTPPEKVITPPATNSEPVSVLTPDLEESESIANSQPVSEPVSVLTPDRESSSTTTPQNQPLESDADLQADLWANPTTNTTPPPPPPKPQPEVTNYKKRKSNTTNLPPSQIGLFWVGSSTVVMAMYYVAIKWIFQKGVEGIGGVGIQQLILPTLGNIFLILMLRLFVVVPLMLLLAPIIYPQIWQDLKNLFTSIRDQKHPHSAKNKRVLLLSLLSGGCLFLSQVLIYFALGQIVTTGAAIALFFIYPIASSLLSWLLFRERLNLLGNGAIAAIFCGVLLILGSSPMGMSGISVGSTTALLSGFAFAAYVILTKLSANKIHPVSSTLIQFTTMLLLSCICLIVPLPNDWTLAINPANILELILSALMLGVLTLCGYLFNNFGLRKLGSPLAAVIGAALPILTVIFAGLILQESLDIMQIFGVLLVTLGAGAINWEKIQNQNQSPNSAR